MQIGHNTSIDIIPTNSRELCSSYRVTIGGEVFSLIAHFDSVLEPIFILDEFEDREFVNKTLSGKMKNIVALDNYHIEFDLISGVHVYHCLYSKELNSKKTIQIGTRNTYYVTGYLNEDNKFIVTQSISKK